MLHVVWSEAEWSTIRNEGRNNDSSYIFAILNDLGLSYEGWDHREWIRKQPRGLTIVLGPSDDERWPAVCAAYCRQGNALLVVGGVYQLHDVLGVSPAGSINEGWIRWEDSALADGLKSSFHFFKASLVEVPNSDVQSWGRVLQRDGVLRNHPAVTLRTIGKGFAALLAVDLMKTVCMIQQGVSVVRDGAPAPDGTASIDDGILKTDDAAVLDWERDRESAGIGGAPFYLHPIADEWKIVFVRVVHMMLDKAGIPFGQVWFWPDGLVGIGHISHDSDRNRPEHARKLLERLREADIRSTWCIIMPGYDEELNRQIVGEGHEIALHYNALEREIPQGRWSEEHFRFQLSMLQEQFPGREIVTNKNHYLRWEGDIEFYLWCERAGIAMEQSMMGGSKQGNKGFLSGTCHPFKPLSTAQEQNRLMNVISLPVLAWDPPMPLRCTAGEAVALLERAVDVNGVAHFLFHPQMLIADHDQVGAMLVSLVRRGKELGIQWWTSEQIGLWLKQRNQVRIQWVEKAENIGMTSRQTAELHIFSEMSIQGLTVLVSGNLQRSEITAAGNGAIVHASRAVERFGCRYLELTMSIQAGQTVLFFNKYIDEGNHRHEPY